MEKLNETRSGVEIAFTVLKDVHGMFQGLDLLNIKGIREWASDLPG